VVLVGSERPTDALWTLAQGRACCVGDVQGLLRAAAWVDTHTLVLAVEHRPVGAPAGPMTVLLRNLAGSEPDRVVVQLPDAGFRTTLTVDRAGRRVVVNTSRGVHLLSLRDDSLVRDIEVFQGDRAGVICGAISPDGTLCLAARASVDGVRLYATNTGALLRHLGGAVTNGIVDACFDPTGTLVAALTLNDHRLFVWNVSDGSVRFQRACGTAPPPALAFSPDGSRLAVSEEGHRVLLLDTRDGAVVYAASDDHSVYRSDDGGMRWIRMLRADARCLLWTPRGRVIAVGDGALYGCVDASPGAPDPLSPGGPQSPR